MLLDFGVIAVNPNPLVVELNNHQQIMLSFMDLITNLLPTIHLRRITKQHLTWVLALPQVIEYSEGFEVQNRGGMYILIYLSQLRNDFGKIDRLKSIWLGDFIG